MIDGWVASNKALAEGEPWGWYGPWASYAFGLDLNLESSDAAPPDKPNTESVKEEGLETLIMLNLFTVFAGWEPCLAPKGRDDWAGADIEATDATGCRHVFELKYGDSVKHVIDQVLAYSVNVLRHVNEAPAAFHELPTTQQERFVACRIAAFWSNTVADKWARDDALPPARRDWSAMEQVIQGRTELTVEACRDAAQRWVTANAANHTPPKRPTSVHFHLVLPNPEGINEGQLLALSRLKFRGVRASIWQAAVQLHSPDGKSKLWIREFWVEPRKPGRVIGKADNACRPGGTRVTKLLAAMSRDQGELHEGADTWKVERRNIAYRHGSRRGPHPCFGIHIIRRDGGEAVQVRVETTAPRWFRRAGGDLNVETARFRAVAHWALAVAPPAPGDPIGAALQKVRATRKKWKSACPVTGLEFSDCWHSSGRRGAYVEFRMPDTLDLAAAAANRAYRLLLDVVAECPEAFAPTALDIPESEDT